MKPTDKQLVDLARLLGATAEQEIDCDALLERVAAYLKSLRENTLPTKELRAVAQHLSVCPECHEEFVALIRAEGLDPSTLLGR